MKNVINEMQTKSDAPFIKHMDIIEINPVMGNRKKIPLKFTRMEFISENLSNKPLVMGQIVIASLGNDELHFAVSAVDGSSYMIETLNGKPLQINKNWVFSALLCHGDRCLVAHNEFIFKKNIKDNSQDGSKLPMPTEIIRSKINILIEGETGTGKTHLAKLIHEESGVTGPFVHLNLSAFSAGLLESELFGHVKGAFTGALDHKDGALKKAHKGTLFLDEIDSISMELQTKLLLFLDSGEYSPVGSQDQYKIDTRIIVASGQNLNLLLEQNRMRKDFYFRISTGHILRLPCLRENKNDIRKACEIFMQKNGVLIEEKLIKYYENKSWPGNYRQLYGHLKYKLAVSPNSYLVFGHEDEKVLDAINGKTISYDDSRPTLKAFKEKYIIDTYHYYQCNINKTAEQLGITTKSVRSYINSLAA